MKKKLLSIVSVVLALSMTTSALAATPRGGGDVDNDGKITANDVLSILKGINTEGNSEANVDGYTGVDGLDARVLYNTILQPRTVSEDLTLKAYSEGMANDVEFRAFDAAGLGATTGHEDPNGLKRVATTVDTTTDTTIKDAIDELVGMAATQRTQGITNQLNRIFFVSAVKGDVYLRSENGWSMFCNALRYIVPMDEETAALCNRPQNGTPMADIEADPELKARYDALQEVKAIVVGEQTDPTAVNESLISAEDIIRAKDAMYRAIPSGLSDEEILNTAKEVFKITDTKYAFTVDSEVTGQETLSEAGVDSSAFIAGLLALKNYDTAKMTDYRNTFGDKLTVGTPNVKVTFEVAVVAGVEDGSEATTVAPVEPTETTTEAPTETTTEAPTETTTEAPAPSGPQVTGDVTISLADVQAKYPAGLSDGDVLADGVSIINGGSTFSYKTNSLSFNNGALSLTGAFQIGKGNKTITSTTVGAVLGETEVVEKGIKFDVAGPGQLTVWAGLGSSGLTTAPVLLIDLSTNTVVAATTVERPDTSKGEYIVTTIDIPAAGQYAYVQPGNVSSLNVAQIDISVKDAPVVEPTTVTTTEAPTETTTEAPTETTTEAPVPSGPQVTGDVTISLADVQAKYPAGLSDGDVLADGVSIINGGSIFSYKTNSLSFNNGALSLTGAFQIGKGNKTITSTTVGAVLGETEVVEKGIKFDVAGPGQLTVWAGLGSSGLTTAPVLLIDLSTNTVVAATTVERPDTSKGEYIVTTIDIPAAGQYAYVQPGNVSSLNVAQIDISVNK